MTPPSRGISGAAYLDRDNYDADQDLRAEGGEPLPLATSQRDMVTASLNSTPHPDVYAKRRQLPRAPQPGALMAAAVIHHIPRAGGPSSPERAPRPTTAAPDGSPTTNATPADQG